MLHLDREPIKHLDLRSPVLGLPTWYPACLRGHLSLGLAVCPPVGPVSFYLPRRFAHFTLKAVAEDDRLCSGKLRTVEGYFQMFFALIPYVQAALARFRNLVNDW